MTAFAAKLTFKIQGHTVDTNPTKGQLVTSWILVLSLSSLLLFGYLILALILAPLIMLIRPDAKKYENTENNLFAKHPIYKLFTVAYYIVLFIGVLLNMDIIHEEIIPDPGKSLLFCILILGPVFINLVFNEHQLFKQAK